MSKQILLTSFTVEELARLIKVVMDTKNITVTNNITTANRWLSRKEAAAYLGLCLPLLDKHTKEGKLSAYRIGRRKLYDVQDLNDSLKNLKIRQK